MVPEVYFTNLTNKQTNKLKITVKMRRRSGKRDIVVFPAMTDCGINSLSAS